MKTKIYSLVIVLQLTLIAQSAFAAPGVTLTTPTIAAANIDQGTSNNIVYAVQMVVSAAGAVTVNNIQFTLSGTHDNNDLTTLNVYFNPLAVSISGASFLGSATATFAAPHVYSIAVFNSMAASTQGFYIIAVNVNAIATDNHTVLINGATNPAVFGFAATTTVTNNQSNKALTQTIQAADITLTTPSIAAANVNQGSTNDIVYAAEMVVSATEPVTVNNIQFTLGGTQDNNDLTTLNVYFNPLAASISGASFLGSATATFAAPQDYSIPMFNSMAAGTHGFYIIAVNVNASATDNHTVVVNGATTPAVFGFTTAPNVTNSQSNKALKQTIQAADITLTTPSIAAANVNQGSTNDIVYAAQMVLSSSEPVTVNTIQFTLSGTQDNNDLTTINIYFNPLAASISGASFLGSATATFAAPQNYSIPIFNSMAAGTQGFYIIAVNVSASATDNHNVMINGATNPVVFGFTTSPNVTNSQTNKALKQTIQAADITLTTPSIAAANVNQGSTNDIVYAAQMVVSATEPVTVNNIQFTLSGTYDNNDLTTVNVYFNPTAVSIGGASFLGSATATFVAPHIYSVPLFNGMASGTQGFYIIAVNVNASATDNHSVFMRGDSTPVLFGFTTSPNVTNSQSNKALKQTIQASDVTLTTPVIAAASIKQGSSNNIVYAAKMVVSTEPVSVNNIQFTLSGTQDNNDLTTVNVYFNAASVSIAGASFIGSTNATFAAPQTYSIPIFNSMAAGTQGFYIIAVNVSSTATIGKNVKVNGATDPSVFGFTTSPNVTNSQSNNAGTQTISAALEMNSGIGNKTILRDNSSVTLNALYPNPASTSFNYSLSSNSVQHVVMRLIDYSGKIVVSRSISLDKGINKFSLDVASLTSGIYNLITTDDSRSVLLNKQIVVQH